MAPCYNNNYDDDTDGDDSDTAHCYTSNSSDVAAFRRSCCTFRRWHKRYGEIEFTFTYNNSSLAQVTYKDCDATKSGVYSDIHECTGIEPFGCLMVWNCLKWQKLLETCPTTKIELVLKQPSCLRQSKRYANLHLSMDQRTCVLPAPRTMLLLRCMHKECCCWKSAL